MVAGEVTIIGPGTGDKGFLRRLKELTALQRRLTKLSDETAVDDMIKFVLKHATVTAPEGVDVADIIMDLSQDDYTAIFNPPDTVKPTKGG